MTASAQREIQMPPASSAAEIQQTIGFTDVRITYSRPRLKGRKFDQWIPQGKVWRTGANRATIVDLSDNVMINGRPVPRGRYSLWTIPEKEKWTVILNSKVTWGTMYDSIKDADVMRFQVPVQKNSETKEYLEFSFEDPTDSTAYLKIAWDGLNVRFQIKDDIHTKLADLIVRRIDSVSALVPRSRNDSTYAANQFFRAAAYYQAQNKDHKQALDWLDKATQLSPLNEFMYRHTKALIYQGQKKKAEAIAEAKGSLRLSENDARAKSMGYVTKNQELLLLLTKEP